jgi:hypothetical protein
MAAGALVGSVRLAGVADRAPGVAEDSLRKVGRNILGWTLLVLGVAALALPGPGLLMLLAGLVVLSQEYDWAERRVEPVKRHAFATAAAGVQTIPRIALSAAAALIMVAVGVVWWLDPPIPEFWVFGPELPFGGWSTGASILVSAALALGLLGWSIRRFRTSTPEAARQEAAAGVRRPD